ncbi:MAG: hypothetical protein WCL00_12455 [Bacteroidota bacterium]
MHKIENPDKSFVVEFPSELSEMSNAQFQKYIDLVLQYDEGKIKEDVFRSKLVQCLLDLRTGFWFRFLSPEQRDSCATNVVRLAELMDSFIEEFEKDHQVMKAFKLVTTRNYVPKLLGYFGPRNGFENLTFCEYRIARNYYRQYVTTKEESYLNYLIAVLYRPAKSFISFRKRFNSWDGETRSIFTSNSNPLALEKRAKDISFAPFHLRYCVFLYFAGCEEFLKSGKPVVDGIELDFSRLFSNSESSDKANVGMIGLLFTLSESGVFGNIEQTDNQNLWDVLVRVYQTVMQSQVLSEKANFNGKG